MSSKTEFRLRRLAGVVFIVWLLLGPVSPLVYQLPKGYAATLVTWYLMLPIVSVLAVVCGGIIFIAIYGTVTWAFPGEKEREKIVAAKIEALQQELKEAK